MLRVLGPDKGVLISGDNEAFAKFCRVWRLVLDHLRDAVHGRATIVASAASYEEGTEDDNIIGRYIWADTPYGKTKSSAKRRAVARNISYFCIPLEPTRANSILL